MAYGHCGEFAAALIVLSAYLGSPCFILGHIYDERRTVHRRDRTRRRTDGCMDAWTVSRRSVTRRAGGGYRRRAPRGVGKPNTVIQQLWTLSIGITGLDNSISDRRTDRQSNGPTVRRMTGTNPRREAAHRIAESEKKTQGRSAPFSRL